MTYRNMLSVDMRASYNRLSNPRDLEVPHSFFKLDILGLLHLCTTTFTAAATVVAFRFTLRFTIRLAVRFCLLHQVAQDVFKCISLL